MKIVKLAASIIAVFGILFAGIATEFYPKAGIITEINNDTVIFEDGAGNLWEFEGAEDYCVDDFVAAIMYKHFTPTIYDDEIVQVKYAGVFR